MGNGAPEREGRDVEVGWEAGAGRAGPARQSEGALSLTPEACWGPGD